MKSVRNSFLAFSHQQGVALMVMMIILVLGTATLLVNSLSKVGFRVEQNTSSSKALSEAKEIIIGNLVAAQGGQTPGALIRPDSFASTETPYNYDGENETGCLDVSRSGSTPTPGLPLTTDPNNIRCLGRLPWKTFGLSIPSPSESDSNGFMPWYAVSANIYDPNVPINSELLTPNSPRPWLTVRDSNGNVLSNRVLFIVILPGLPIGNQTRAASPNLAGANQYLDSITVPSNCTSPCIPGTYNNYDLDNDFIMGEDHRWVTDSSTGKQVEDASYQFNDRLIYVTIDEVMPLVEKRVAGEARSILKNYFNVRSQFPDATLLGASGVSSPGNDSGMLPRAFACACSSSTNCTCNFSLIRRVEFTRSGSNTWTSNSGACSRTNSNQTCRCTGDGNCMNGLRNFTCNANGACTHNTSGSYKFKRKSTTPTTSFSSPSGGCSTNSSDIVCNSAGSFEVQDSQWTIPNWFTDNQWDSLIYYHRSTTSNLQAGTQGNIQALLISAGNRITSTPYASKGSAQARPSSDLGDYLDSIENTDGDFVFEDASKLRTNSYNDLIYIVSP
jgi:hypothetical protein